MKLLIVQSKTSLHTLKTIYRIVILSLFIFIISSCGGSGGSSNNDTDTFITIEQQLHTALDAVNTDTDFTMMVESNNGAQFIHRRGNSTETSVYRSASTSKMVSASVILLLVEQGIISLDDNPQDYIDFWPTTGNLAAIQLRHLLSFTSGLSNEPACLNLPNADFTNCVENILNTNSSTPAPGEEFYYASTHLPGSGFDGNSRQRFK